jgi:Tetratricopeptide repeat
MNRTCKLLAVALAGAALFSLDFHSRSSAATELSLGVEAFNKTEGAEAIEHLEKAVSLDPENQCARVYLATAYAKEYRPGVTTPENTYLAEQAIEQYQHVLDFTPNRTLRIDSAKGIAGLYLQMNKFDDSKKYYQMASDLDPKDPGPHSSIGLIDILQRAREEMKLGSLESVGVCQTESPASWAIRSHESEPYADADAYEVYSALIPRLSPNPETKTWFIGIDTLPIGGSLDDQARKLWTQTRGADSALDDYYKVNRKIWLLQKKFTLPNPYRLVTREQLKAMFPPHFREGNFGELWLELSAVGFNANKTLAVVYMANFCATQCCCAAWNSYVLQKQNDMWKVSSETGCGIS